MSSPTFIYSIIYLYQYRVMYIYFIHWIIIQYTLFFFCSKFLFIFGHWEHFYVTSSVSFLITRGCCCFCCLSTLLLSGAIWCSRLILYFPCPSPRMCNFFQVVLVPFIGECNLETKTWALVSLWLLGGLASRTSLWSENIHV